MRCGRSNATCTTGFSLLTRLQSEESGADMIEYTLIGTQVALAAIAGMQGVGNKMARYYSSIASSL